MCIQTNHTNGYFISVKYLYRNVRVFHVDNYLIFMSVANSFDHLSQSQLTEQYYNFSSGS